MNTSYNDTQPAQIAFVGGGQMAMAMISGLIKAGQPGHTITVIEPVESQRQHLAKTFGVCTLECADESLANQAVIVWAVKPQVMQQVIETTLPATCKALHLSIAAGLPLGVLKTWLHSEKLVRAMPNMPALIGKGITGLAAGTEVTKAEREMIEQIVASMGYHFWVHSDAEIDAVTAVSGSGPAYVFHFMESFQAAAQALGFDAASARELVLRTTAGAVSVAEGGEDFGSLRTRVTSKRGTTEAALDVMAKARMSETIAAAVKAALVRAGELSDELSH